MDTLVSLKPISLFLRRQVPGIDKTNEEEKTVKVCMGDLYAATQQKL